jgi:hypothetical protein
MWGAAMSQGTASPRTQDDPRAPLRRLDAVAELIEMERMISEGGPVSSLEIEQQIARCVDQVMSDESVWTAASNASSDLQ